MNTLKRAGYREKVVPKRLQSPSWISCIGEADGQDFQKLLETPLYSNLASLVYELLSSLNTCEIIFFLFIFFEGGGVREVQ